VYTKLRFGRVLKRSLSAHWMQVKLFLPLLILELQTSRSFCRKTVRMDVKLLDGSDFKKPNLNRFLVFHTPLTTTEQQKSLVLQDHYQLCICKLHMRRRPSCRLGTVHRSDNHHWRMSRRQRSETIQANSRISWLAYSVHSTKYHPQFVWLMFNATFSTRRYRAIEK